MLKHIDSYHKIIGAWCFLLMCSGLISQNLKEYYIDCDTSDLNLIYDNYAQEIYIPVTVTHDSLTLNDARMRIRGDGSKSAPKKSLKLKFDDVIFPNHKATLNFNAEWSDKSYLQQSISSFLLKKAGVPCFNAEHVRVYLNGQFWGLYLSIENMDEGFLTANNLDTLSNLYKATVDGASLSVYDDIFTLWEKKNGKGGRYDLYALIQALDTVSDEGFYTYMKSCFYYDKLMSILASNLLLRNYSSYYHNYYMLHDVNNTKKWMMLPWDLDKTFLYYENSYPYDHTSKFWAPDNPLLERVILNPNTFSDLNNRVSELHGLYFNDTYVTSIVDSLEVLLNQSVNEDETDNVSDTIEWQSWVNSAKTAFDVRYNNLMDQFSNRIKSFKVYRTPPVFHPSQDITFNWESTSDPEGLGISYILKYSNQMNLDDPSTVAITGITDTNYTLQNDLENNQYYWEVEATNGNYTLDGFNNFNYFYVNPDTNSVIINEINYNSNPEANIEDWIELYNPSLQDIDIGNWTFTDGKENNLFTFPPLTIIPKGGYLVVLKDSTVFNEKYPYVQNTIGEFDFGLKPIGEPLQIRRADGSLVDIVYYGNISPWPLESDIQNASIELVSSKLDNNLGRNWQNSFINATPGVQNSSRDSIIFPASWNISVYPNPFQNELTIEYRAKESGFYKITLYDYTGKLMYRYENDHQEIGLNTIHLDNLSLANGIYFLKVEAFGVGGKMYKLVQLR